MGNLKAALDALPRTKKGPRCGVATLVAALSKEDAKELQEALRSDQIQSAALAQALSKAYRSELTQHTIARHRRGHCSCQN